MRKNGAGEGIGDSRGFSAETDGIVRLIGPGRVPGQNTPADSSNRICRSVVGLAACRIGNSMKAVDRSTASWPRRRRWVIGRIVFPNPSESRASCSAEQDCQEDERGGQRMD